MRQDCTECQRLWREYAAATNTHVELESKLRLASMERDSKSGKELARQIAAAGTVRDKARQAIQQHETDAHAGAADAADMQG
jgi:hypothetical protein